MGKIRKPLVVKLFVGMLGPDESLFEQCGNALVARYGPAEPDSEVMPWQGSEYYTREMGSVLSRRFLFFEKPVLPEELIACKLMTQELEQKFAEKGQRRVNLDPGYVTEAKVVLASTKDFSHRIYVAEGLYAEVTLRYSSGKRSFEPLDYTYPDYRSEVYIALFNNARMLLRESMQKG
jgi:hypothetical protein